MDNVSKPSTPRRHGLPDPGPVRRLFASHDLQDAYYAQSIAAGVRGDIAAKALPEHIGFTRGGHSLLDMGEALGWRPTLMPVENASALKCRMMSERNGGPIHPNRNGRHRDGLPYMDSAQAQDAVRQITLREAGVAINSTQLHHYGLSNWLALGAPTQFVQAIAGHKLAAAAKEMQRTATAIAKHNPDFFRKPQTVSQERVKCSRCGAPARQGALCTCGNVATEPLTRLERRVLELHAMQGQLLAALRQGIGDQARQAMQHAGVKA